jgi:hypothetical protein
VTSRRRFLQIGITATAWPLASKAAVAAGLDVGTSSLAIYKVVVDERFAESVEFGGRANGLGLDVQAISGDMTRLWYDDLYHEWQRRPVAIAGLTAHGPMFCLEMLGRDQGLRVVFKGVHAVDRSGTLRHALSGPIEMLDAALELGDDGEGWTCRIADVIARCPRGRSEISTRATEAAGGASETSGLSRGTQRETLYSWVIAPAARG